jgi:hypothetical protein
MDRGKKPGGGISPWRRRAIGYRVASALLVLQQPQAGPADPSHRTPTVPTEGFVVERVSFRREVKKGLVRSRINEKLDLAVALGTKGPHCFRLPWYDSSTDVDEAVTDAGDQVEDVHVFRGWSSDTPNMLIFGEAHGPGRALRMALSRNRLRSRFYKDGLGVLEYRVERPVATLVLECRWFDDWSSDKALSWQLFKQGPLDRDEVRTEGTIARGSHDIAATITNPEVGTRYKLRGPYQRNDALDHLMTRMDERAAALRRQIDESPGDTSPPSGRPRAAWFKGSSGVATNDA